MALVVVNTLNSNPIIPEQEHVEGYWPHEMTFLVTGENCYGGVRCLELPFFVERLDQEVVITSLEADYRGRGRRLEFWRINWVPFWRRKELDHIDLFLFMERDDVKISYSPRDARGYIHLAYKAFGSDTMCFGIWIEPGTTLKIESMKGGETYYFAVRQDEDGELSFSRPSAEEAEADAIWRVKTTVFQSTEEKVNLSLAD